MIDIAPLLSPAASSEDKAAVHLALRKALSLKGPGIMQLTGHGWDDAFLDDCFAAGQAHFDLPLQSKMQVGGNDSGNNRGYLPISDGDPAGFEVFAYGQEGKEEKEEGKEGEEGSGACTTTSAAKPPRRGSMSSPESGMVNMWPSEAELSPAARHGRCFRSHPTSPSRAPRSSARGPPPTPAATSPW